MTGSSSEPLLDFSVLRPNQLGDVHRLMYQSFHIDEPMTSHLQLCQVRGCERDCESGLYPLKGHHSIPDSDAMADSLVTDHNLSLMAVDRETNSPVAVMLNGVFHRSEIDAPPTEVVDLVQTFFIVLISNHF